MTSAAITDQVDPADASARVATLFEKYGRMVYGISRAMLRDTHDAEDATQQTFLSAHRALLQGGRVRDEGAWLATIARNECRARITAGMRRPLSLGDDDLALIADPGDEVSRRSQADALRSALAELPERQREAVVLRDLYGLRYGEVAKALGISRAATETLLFRARRSMRQRLRPVVTTALVVPLSVQEGLAQALPGFAAAPTATAAITATAGGGLLAKLAAGPASVKIATAAVAVTTVGAVGTAESERADRDRAERAPIVAGVDRDDDASSADLVAREQESSDDHGRSGDTKSGRGKTGQDDDADNDSGSGSDGDREDDDRSGSSGRGGGEDDDSSGSDPSDTGPDDRSGSSDDETPDRDDDSSGSSGPGSDDGPDDGSGDSGDDSSGSGSGGSGGSDDGDESGSGGSGSDDSGSGSDSGSDDEEEDSSGKGSSGDEDKADDH